MFRQISLPMVFLLMQLTSSATGSEQPADCLIDRGPCSTTAGTQRVVLDISPKPVRAMKELTFTIHVGGRGAPPSLLLSLSMPGMYMGRNIVTLKKISGDSYSGKGVIPRCPSGKRLWQAEVSVPGASKAVYRFNVTY